MNGHVARTAVALLTSGTLLLSVPAATAVTRVLADPNESGSLSDVRRVTVSHRYNADDVAGRVRVVARVGNVDYGDHFKLWIDTPNRKRNYFVAVYPDSDYGPVQKVLGWRTEGRNGCLSWDARSSAGQDQDVAVSIPRRCLAYPGRVRVAFQAVYQFDQGKVRDWVPSRRAYTPWLRVS